MAFSPDLDALTPAQLDSWFAVAQQQARTGTLPDYIPALAQANPEILAIAIRTCRGNTLMRGDRTHCFPLMSVMKPFLLLYLLATQGAEAVFAQVGMDPSDRPYNALSQLQADRGFPRNPMLNSGAIALAARLPGETPPAKCLNLCEWLNQQAGSHLYLHAGILASVRSRPNVKNQALAALLAASGFLAQPAALALDTYEQICCLAGTVADLSRLGMLLVNPPTGLDPAHCRVVSAIMSTCGLYEYSGRFAVTAGVPCKSGVSGALMAIVPGQGVIACYSPPLDANGNSVAGIWLVQALATALRLSVFYRDVFYRNVGEIGVGAGCPSAPDEDQSSP